MYQFLYTHNLKFQFSNLTRLALKFCKFKLILKIFYHKKKINSGCRIDNRDKLVRISK